VAGAAQAGGDGVIRLREIGDVVDVLEKSEAAN